MHTIDHDGSDKLITILPGLREHAATREHFGRHSTPVSVVERLIAKLLEAQGYSTDKRTLARLMRLFAPFEERKPRFVDRDFLQTIVIKSLPEDAVFDILYFHHCWANPLFRQLLEGSFYPYMIARDRITRKRVMADLEELVGRYTKNTMENAFIPMTKHHFMRYDRSTMIYDFTYRTVHPLAFLYATYRELGRKNLKIMGVHRIDNLMELEYIKWLMLTRSQVVALAKQLDDEKLSGYSFQIEEQLHVKYSFNGFLDKLKNAREEGT